MQGKDVGEWVSSVCASRSASDVEAVYDQWATSYERDLSNAGIQLPGLATALFCRHTPTGSTPIFEAGVGTGMVGELLYALGYPEIVGIDVSTGMLAQAREKNIYASLRRMRLGEPLDYPDEMFEGAIAVGVFTPGHAPPVGLSELIRITKTGSPVLFSVRVNDGEGDDFLDYASKLEEAKRWQCVERTHPITTLPFADSRIKNIVLAYQKLG